MSQTGGTRGQQRQAAPGPKRRCSDPGAGHTLRGPGLPCPHAAAPCSLLLVFPQANEGPRHGPVDPRPWWRSITQTCRLSRTQPSSRGAAAGPAREGAEMKGGGERGKGAYEGDRAPVDTARRHERPRAAAGRREKGTHRPLPPARPPPRARHCGATETAPVPRRARFTRLFRQRGPARAAGPRRAGPDVETETVCLGAGWEGVPGPTPTCQEVRRPVFP